MLAYYRVAFYTASHGLLDLRCTIRIAAPKNFLLSLVQSSQSQQTDSTSDIVPASVDDEALRTMLESSQSNERCEAVSVLEEKVAIRETVHLHAGFQLLSLLTRHLVVVIFMTLSVDSARGVRLHGCCCFPSCSSLRA
jgi:hypothetical protein